MTCHKSIRIIEAKRINVSDTDIILGKIKPLELSTIPKKIKLPNKLSPTKLSSKSPLSSPLKPKALIDTIHILDSDIEDFINNLIDSEVSNFKNARLSQKLAGVWYLIYYG